MVAAFPNDGSVCKNGSRLLAATYFYKNVDI